MVQRPDSTPAPAVFGPPDDPRPWVRPANKIAQRIADGTYKPGQWLPIMTTLRDELGATRTDIERALLEARAEGLITTVMRVGSYPGTGPQPPGMPARPPRQPKTGSADQGARPDPLREQYITVSELAARLRVSKMTAYRLIHDGEIHNVIQVGRSYRIPETAAQAYLAGNRIGDDQPGPGQAPG